MRIIAGTARSLPLKTPEGMHTRPTSDKIKETLFNILQNEIPGSRFLDLFSGSGQIGLEALSRGAREAVFVENDRPAIACIGDNIAFTKFDRKARLLAMDAFGALRTLEGEEPFDVIYMDPPYDQGLEEQVLARLAGSSLLHEDSVIVVEASLKTDFSYIEELGYMIKKNKQYKTNRHMFLRLAQKGPE